VPVAVHVPVPSPCWLPAAGWACPSGSSPTMNRNEPDRTRTVPRGGGLTLAGTANPGSSGVRARLRLREAPGTTLISARVDALPRPGRTGHARLPHLVAMTPAVVRSGDALPSTAVPSSVRFLALIGIAESRWACYSHPTPYPSPSVCLGARAASGFPVA